MTDGTFLRTQWQHRGSAAVLRAAGAARGASVAAEEAGVALQASTGVDWSGRAAEAYRDRCRSLQRDTAAAGAAADDLAARLRALAAAVGHGP